MTSEEPSFPPLLSGHRLEARVDPMSKAIAAAQSGIDAGAVFYADRGDLVSAAVVFAPETPLGVSMAMLPVAACGLGDALGALAPPEVAVTWAWPDGVRINGARCGAFTCDASTSDPAATPDWLIIGLTLQLAPLGGEPGDDPTVTALWEEGCVELTAPQILESWSRHMLVWVNRWLDDGFRPVHDAWVGRIDDRGEEVAFDYGGAPRRGLFLGLDETGAMLLKTEATTEALPLVALLDHPRPWPPKPASRDGAVGRIAQ